MKCRWRLAAFIVLFAVGLNSCTTSNSTTPATGSGFLWVATQGDQMVRSFAVNLSTGATAQLGASAPTGLGPIAMAITPAGDALFIANRDDNTISAYTFKSDGSLMAASSATTDQMPVALTVDPTGKLLFVANQGSGTVSVFSVASAALTKLTSFASDPLSLATGPSAVVVPPPSFTCSYTPPGTMTSTPESCYFLYIANQFTSTVSAYAYFVDSSGNFLLGAVDSGGNFVSGGIIGNAPYAAGTNPSGLAFSRCAGTTTATTACPTTAPPSYLFVANTGSNNISIFSACIQTTATCPSPNGTLTQVGAPVSAGGTHPISFIVDPVLDFVYAVDNGSFQVSEYKYSSATGALTPLSPATASTGANPLGGGITSDGNWVFIPNNGGSSLSAFVLKVATGTTPTGELAVGTAIPLAGQPSVVLVK